MLAIVRRLWYYDYNSKITVVSKGVMIVTIKIKDPKEFKILMIKKGFTQRGLARAAEISDTTVCHLLSDKRGCSPEIAAKIYTALGVEFDDIFFIDDADNSKHSSTTVNISTGTEGGV